MEVQEKGFPTREERQFRVLMIIWAVGFVAGIFAAVVPPFLYPWLSTLSLPSFLRDMVAQIPQFYTNPVLMVAAAAAEAQMLVVSLLVISGLRTNSHYADVFIWGKIVFVAGFFVFGVLLTQPPLFRGLLRGSMVFDLVQMVSVMIFRARAVRSRFQLKAITPRAFEALTALAEVTVPVSSADGYPPTVVGQRVDGYLGSFESPRKSAAKLEFLVLEFFPWLFLRPSFSRMGVEERRTFVKKRFYGSTGMVRDLIRTAKQMIYLSFYSDPKTNRWTEYTEFRDRPPKPGVEPPDPRPEPPSPEGRDES